jgi:hypothetical protein
MGDSIAPKSTYGYTCSVEGIFPETASEADSTVHSKTTITVEWMQI